jgi:hypothetical protein
MFECFGGHVAADKRERNHRFLEESLELVQSHGCTEAEALELVAYVYGRPIGEPVQELGGVMVTLAALSEAHGLDMDRAGLIELARVSEASTMNKIRAKQAAKPMRGPLPGPTVQLPDGPRSETFTGLVPRRPLDDWRNGENMAVQNQRDPQRGGLDLWREAEQPEEPGDATGQLP